jgi:hypothetical protein
MISAQTPSAFVATEKPVSRFPDHALKPAQTDFSLFFSLCVCRGEACFGALSRNFASCLNDLAS